jgi:DNA-binding NtrC family response regulator
VPKIPFEDDDQQLPTVSRERAPLLEPRGVRATVVLGVDAGLEATSTPKRLIIGRAPGVELRLTDPTVSSFHVELAADAEGVSVRDVESLNGTRYHGARISGAVVPSGSVLEVGSTSVRVDLDVPLPSEAPNTRGAFGALRGRSSMMLELYALLERLAPTDLSMLIEGPTGTGKELAARAIHEASSHASGPFVVLDCTAIPATLAESMLFGHERGAFTGATERRPGVFEAAADGTLFLDEVGELPLELQPKLLRVLEHRQVTRVGSSQPIVVGARILSATWRDLRARVNQAQFREDLYYRLAQARVHLPSLGERADDIPILVQHFMEGLPQGARCARAISADAVADLAQREFRGNVRELRHTVERAAMIAQGDIILPSDLAFERMLMGECQRSSSAATEASETDAEPKTLPFFKEAKRTLVDEFERDYLERLLGRAGKNLSRASALAGIERHHLRDLLRKHGLWTTD